MSKKNRLDDYEVGYGKPPKNTQFQKGHSGNPKGRPKKALDFDHELIRESNSFMTITENGRRKRVSKHNVTIMQLLKQAMTGNIQAARVYLDRRQKALERAVLVAEPQANNSRNYDDVKSFTREELRMIIAAGLEKEKQEGGKGQVSNTD
jgi:Family of unknown function (DUF5681)